MLGSQSLLFDAQGLLKEGLGLLILVLAPVEPCQFMQGLGRARVFWSFHLLMDALGSLVEGLSLLILALLEVELCQLASRCDSNEKISRTI